MAQLKNLIVNGASRFLGPIKGDLSGTSDYALKLETYKQGSSTETYGTSYPLWAQWETGSILKLLCTGYSTKVDIANQLATPRTVKTNLGTTSAASFDGTANITPGVSGTLPVSNGGTGATSLTSDFALVGKGTSAISSSNLKISNYEASLTASTSAETKYIATNSLGSVSLWASTNRGLYDQTSGKWIIASKSDGSKTYAPRWASLGGTAKPVYFDSDGSPVACSATVGSGTKPVYMSSGTITASSSTVGGAAKPVYMSSGAITACSSTVGSTDTPVYMSSGTITTTGKKFSDYVTLATAQTISGSKTFSSNIQITTGSARVKFSHSSTGKIGCVGINTDGDNFGLYDDVNSKYLIYTDYTTAFVPRWASIGSGTKPVYFNSSGKAVASSSTVGTSTTPVYMSSGTLTACSRAIPVVYTASECTSYTSDSGTCTPAAVKKAVTTFGDDRYVRLTTDQTISDNKTFKATTYFANAMPLEAGSGSVGTLANPWEYMAAKYVRACDGTNDNYYCYMRPYTVGTSSTIGNGRLTLGNSIAEGTAGNARGSLVIYSGGTQYCIITGYAGYIAFTFG